MNDKSEPYVAEKQKPVPLPADPEGRWDWEFYQAPPEPKRRWSVPARIVWKGRAKPLPTTDPEDEHGI
ncbi:MAG TPA: hypothetical protein VGJ05_08280 [Fimbriiglobus sp.]|jgi:hypothetical protein